MEKLMVKPWIRSYLWNRWGEAWQNRTAYRFPSGYGKGKR